MLEREIIVAPVVLGSGRALFSGLSQRIDLRSVELTGFDDGTAFVRYEVQRP